MVGTGLRAASILTLGALAVFAVPAGASVIVLQDANSSVQVDPQAQDGMLSWEIDGVEQMLQQWFWYRVGSTGPESSINTLDLVGTQTSDTNGDITGDTNVDHLFIRYGTADTFWLDVEYDLTGGAAGSGASDVAEVITITNNDTEALDIHLFQYCNFDLMGSAGDDSVEILNGNQALQDDPVVTLFETVVTGSPDHWEAALSSVTIGSLTDANPTTLSDASSAGPGDVTWAFQWDRTIEPGDTFQISKDKNILIPEPGTLALLTLGGFTLLLRRRKRRG